MADVRAAEYIVAGTATSVAARGKAMIMEVDRTIKGGVPSTIHPTEIVTSFCGDGALGLRSGSRVIFARHFRFGAASVQLDAYWRFDAKGTLVATSVATFLHRAHTYKGILAELQGLPNTSTAQSPPVQAGIVNLVAGFLGVLALAWRFGPRRPTWRVWPDRAG